MKTPGILSQDDVRRIAAQPYRAVMPHRTVLAALEDTAAAHPARAALTWIASADPSQPARTWTHAQLVGAFRRAARAFRALAGGAPPRVAFLLPAIPQAYVTLFGAEACGVACPINHLLGEAHIAELLQAARVNILVALGPHPALDIWSRVPGLRQRCPSLRHVVAVGGAEGALDFDALLAAQASGPLAAHECAPPEAVAALFHTGGTTGRPKLAQHTQANQLHAAWGAACMYGASEDDVILNGFPLFHVAGAFVYGLSILLAGGEVVLPTLTGLRDAAFMRHYWRFAERHRVTLLAAVPTVMVALREVPRQGENLSGVRCLLTGGSPLPQGLADAFERQTGIGVRNILGMTECAGVIAIEPANAPRVPGSAGLPLPFTRVAAAQDGVLRVAGPNVGPGYADPANDAGVFLPGGWLVTGDIGRVDEAGRVHLSGRAKDVIIRSSHNIDPVVIEEALLAHPDVQMAAAVGAPDEYAGEVPVAYVALRPGATVDAAALAAFAQARIPERPAYPKAIFVLPALPVTAIGKLFKPELRARAAGWAIQARIAASGLDGRVRVEAHAGAQGPTVRLQADDDAALVAQLQRLVAGFALDCRIERQAAQGARP